MVNDLIVVRQLPIIEERMRELQKTTDERINYALSLECTEESYKEIKRIRADLHKEYVDLEQRRKDVKSAILAPYNQFENVYNECVGDRYKNADKELKSRIAKIEDGIKQRKKDEIAAYFAEYCQCLNVTDEFADFEKSGIKITLTESLTSLKNKCHDYVSVIVDDLEMIKTQENAAEILVEYKKVRNVSQAIKTVVQRHRLIEAERLREEPQIEPSTKTALPVPDVVAAPTVIEQDPENDNEQEQIFTTTFTVKGTLTQLKELKAFLEAGNYDYE